MNNVDRIVFCVCCVIFGAVIGVELTAALRPNRTVYLLVKDPPREYRVLDCSAEGLNSCRMQRRNEKVKGNGA